MRKQKTCNVQWDGTNQFPSFKLTKCSIEDLPLPYFNDVHRAHDIGVEGILHVLRSSLQQLAFGQVPSVVNQQVETCRPHQRAHLLGALFYATKVSGV